MLNLRDRSPEQGFATPEPSREPGGEGDRWPALNASASAPVWHWLAAALDEIDYGILLLSDGLHASYVNYAARVELDGTHPLQLLGSMLCARLTRDVALLRHAIDQASTRGLRRLLTLGEGEHQRSVSIVSLGLAGPAPGAVLIVLGKSSVCESLSMQGYARAHGLTLAETRVLVELSRGAKPADIACELGVAISTIRSQIGSLRTKTGAPSIRALLRQLSVLPPLKGILRGALGSNAPRVSPC